MKTRMVRIDQETHDALALLSSHHGQKPGAVVKRLARAQIAGDESLPPTAICLFKGEEAM